jgi:hypothetical protein
VHFEADLDLPGETSRCNCSFCRKARFWKAIAKADELRVTAGADMLSEYTVTGFITHCFCRRCGIKPFGRGNMEALGGTFYGVNLACLDDATDEELAEAQDLQDVGTTIGSTAGGDTLRVWPKSRPAGHSPL